MIPLIQTEVGRVEFTPDYVLVIDRLHKEYIKAEYSQLGFLKDNGLDFYSLQSLFWNELLLPGTQKVGEGDLDKFTAEIDALGDEVPVTLTSGKLNFKWNARRADHHILSALVTYLGSAHGTSSLAWNYGDFKAVGAKKQTLIVLADNNACAVKSIANIAGAKSAQVNTINTYDVINADTLIICRGAVEKLEEVYA